MNLSAPRIRPVETALLFILISIGSLLAPAFSQGQQADVGSVSLTRLVDAAIIGPGMHPSIGENIQGPTALRVPDWVQNPLGRYYLYFADHKGLYIRLAYADERRLIRHAANLLEETA